MIGASQLTSQAATTIFWIYPYFHYFYFLREISNLIEQLVVLSPHDKIDLEDLPSYIRMEQPNRIHFNPTQGWNLPEALANLEKDIISRAMKTFGSQRKAAVPLGIDQSTLARKIKKHGIF